MLRLYKNYYTIIQNELGLHLNCKNVMQIPTIEKITLNIGHKDIISDKKQLIASFLALEIISGQKPIITKSAKDVAILKLPKDTPIGCKVTLRNELMYNFLDKLIFLTLPRIRNFSIYSKIKVNNANTFTFKLKDLLIFHELELEYDYFYKLKNLDISIKMKNTKTPHSVLLLLRGFNFPVE